MKLYQVEAKEVDYDEYDTFVVWAKSSEEALELARNEARSGFRERKTNFDSDVTISEVKKPKQSGILLGSFNAG